VKISHENRRISSAKNYRLHLEESRTLSLDHLLTFTDKSKEFCLNSRDEGPLLLYVEVVRTPSMEGVPKVMIHYDLEKIDDRVLSLGVSNMGELALSLLPAPLLLVLLLVLLLKILAMLVIMNMLLMK
jgi:hypothetical protein